MLCKSFSSVANGKNRRYFSRAVSRNPNKKSTYLLWQLLAVMTVLDINRLNTETDVIGR